ncbi:MAG: sugar kinase [Actinomycetes bacterium]
MSGRTTHDGPATWGGLVTLGETMGLLTPAQTGPLPTSGPLRLGMAGSESNVAIGVRRLGLPATWIGRVGNDPVGDLVLRELRAEQVTVCAVRDDAPTALMLKERRTADLTRVLYYRAGCAGSHLRPEDVDADAVSRAQVLHVTGITPALGQGPADAVGHAVDIARGAGVTVSVDLNYRARLWPTDVAAPVLRTLLARADVVFAGEDEARLVAEGDDPEALVAGLAAYGPAEVVVKRGAEGCVALVDGKPFESAAVPVTSVDPVGAGDAFVAGWLAELIAGSGPAVRMATAVAAGAFAVTVAGDWEGMPRPHELHLLDPSDGVLR